MTDADVRRALMADGVITGPLSEGARVIPELGLHGGKIRADVGVVAPDWMAGYEIKSLADTLKRLPTQVEIYSAVFDRCVLVAATKHIAKARAIVPEWWGITEATATPFGVQLGVLREPQSNPGGDVLTAGLLLWKDELEEILRERDMWQGLSGARYEFLVYRLCRLLDPDEVRCIVREYLIKRTGWRSAFKKGA